MPRRLYSYRLRAEVPLLTDEEYAPVRAALDRRFELLRDDSPDESKRKEAHQRAASEALDIYERLTGVRLDHPDQLFYIRLSYYGRPCPECARPFRTPRAKLCAECGFELPAGELAGPAEA